jgi:competence protein ComEA
MDRSAAPWRVIEAADAPAGAGPATPASPAPASGLGGPWLAFAALAVSGVFAVGAFAVAASGGGSVTVEGAESSAASPAGSDAPGSSGLVVVEVAGAVVEPGVYRLPGGTRVGEAIDRAGGYGPRVDAERASRELNLAAVLGDGDRILVPSRDDPPTTVGPPDDGGSPAGGEDEPAGGLINLNTASQTELESLPGVGPVTAGKIIESREGQPFGSVDELRARGIVGEKTFESLRDLVTVN